MTDSVVATTTSSAHGQDGGAAVELVHLRKHFGEVRAVDGVDLTIADGEFFSMLGPSGSGKTTVLRLLMTLEDVTDGVIYVDGEPHHRLKGEDIVEHLVKMAEQKAAEIEAREKAKAAPQASAAQ